MSCKQLYFLCHCVYFILKKASIGKEKSAGNSARILLCMLQFSEVG